MDTLVRQLTYSTDIKVYRPQFKRELGSVTASILLNQMIYWWHKMGYNSFYKFKEPCQHPLYHKGQSWCEELEFSKKEFDNAMKKLKERDLVSSKRDNNNKVWYFVNYDQLSAFLKKAYSENPEDTIHQGFEENVQKVLAEVGQSAMDSDAKLETVQRLLGQGSEDKNRPKSPLVVVPVYPLWAFTSIYRRLQQKITNKPSLKLRFENYKFHLINTDSRIIFLESINKDISEKLYVRVGQQREESPMDLSKLTSIVGGNAEIAAKIQEKMPKPVAAKKGRTAHNAVIIAWKSAYGEVSSSFTGKLTIKDESLLKHISRDYPEDAVNLIEHCVCEWQQFGNEVIRQKGVSVAPQLPSISFLSAHREVAHSFYRKSLSEAPTSNGEGTSSSPMPTLPQGGGFASVDSFFGEDS